MKPPETSTTLLRDLAACAENARWAEFVTRYRPMMDAYMRERFPSVEADEAIAETLIALVDVFRSYCYDPEETGRFHNYLTGVLRHKALRLCRQAERERGLRERAAAEPRVTPDDPEEENYRKSLLDIAVRQFFKDETIAPRTKEIFRRTAIKGESPEAVAKSFLMERHAVDQVKSRSIANLRNISALTARRFTAPSPSFARPARFAETTTPSPSCEIWYNTSALT